MSMVPLQPEKSKISLTEEEEEIVEIIDYSGSHQKFLILSNALMK